MLVNIWEDANCAKSMEKMQNLISSELQSAPVEHLSYGSYGSYEAD